MSDAFWQAMGPVLIALVGGPLLALVTRPEKKPADPPPDAPATAEREHVEACHGVPTDDMSDSLVRVLARMDDRFDKQSDELAEVRGMWTQARDHVSEVHDWLDDGMPSPPGRPARPAWAPSKRPIV